MCLAYDGYRGSSRMRYICPHPPHRIPRQTGEGVMRDHDFAIGIVGLAILAIFYFIWSDQVQKCESRRCPTGLAPTYFYYEYKCLCVQKPE